MKKRTVKHVLFGTVQYGLMLFYANVMFQIAAAAGLGQNVQEIVSLEGGKYYNCSQTALTADKN